MHLLNLDSKTWLLAAMAGWAVAAAQAGTGNVCASATATLPVRSPQALTGTAFAQQVSALNDAERELAIREALLAGNLPDFLRRAVPLEMQGEGRDGVPTRLVLCVLPDYLAIGSDADFLRMPMGLDTALGLARAFGFSLPTRRIVDAIYLQASVRLAPQPLPPGEQMRSTAYYLRHQQILQQQWVEAGAAPGRLAAGHKKDLVLSRRLWLQPGRVAIYGWHREVGLPIQPLSLVHAAAYADYSHGVRLIAQTAYRDGRPVSLFELLSEEPWFRLLSDEGPLPAAGELVRSGSP
ncbi:hypothetical protein [Pelomonas sp. SE-A7]|uniref:hypothetical protein n=1 Tax=Pelomonas sp. SE-A7 TaxID=3054953 RepID=UPI00259C76D0|nr:hypothetical protein [Pelomonas sp. SE-A7]MDM4767834.1 hypothetical protein [Pelomonas sp. SE-A7]